MLLNEIEPRYKQSVDRLDGFMFCAYSQYSFGDGKSRKGLENLLINFFGWIEEVTGSRIGGLRKVGRMFVLQFVAVA